MDPEEIREKFDEAIGRQDLGAALKLIEEAEEEGFDATDMRDIWARHDADNHTD